MLIPKHRVALELAQLFKVSEGNDVQLYEPPK